MALHFRPLPEPEEVESYEMRERGDEENVERVGNGYGITHGREPQASTVGVPQVVADHGHEDEEAEPGEDGEVEDVGDDQTAEEDDHRDARVVQEGSLAQAHCSLQRYVTQLCRIMQSGMIEEIGEQWAPTSICSDLEA